MIRVVNAFIWLMAWLPLPVHYALAAVLRPIIQYIIRYRRNVIRHNLKNAFPDRSEKALRAIEKGFYRHLCNGFVEVVWMRHASPQQMRQHLEFENIELLFEAFDSGRNVIALFGHHCNWEWVSAVPLYMRNGDKAATLYKPLSNKTFDKVFFDLRTHFGTDCIPHKRVLRALVDYKKRNQPIVLAFIADQTPDRHNLNFWTQFLHQDTPCLTGWEQIARRNNDRIIYLDMVQTARGHYKYTLRLLSDAPAQAPENSLVEKYMRALEQSIEKQPELWLWSHRRWKHHRPQEANTATTN